jgi:hypothetical protein
MAHRSTKRKSWRRLFFSLLLLATACEPVSEVSPLYSAPCSPPTNSSNIYKEASEQYPDGPIFVDAFRTWQPHIDTDVRKRALLMLKERVRRWSSFQDILVSDDQVIRITITFIHPELVEIIYLNHALSQFTMNSKEQFTNELKSQLEKLAEHDELFFLITITDSEYSPLITDKDVIVMDLPVQSVSLINSENKRVFPSRYDPPLGQDIEISRRHLSGYIVFPMYVNDKDDKCVLLLDPFSNTTITLGVPDIKVSTSVGNDSYHPLTWFIRYHPLLDINPTPTLAIVLTQAITPECCQNPPPPVLDKLPTDEVYWNDYWIEMARYVWGYVAAP